MQMINIKYAKQPGCPLCWLYWSVYQFMWGLQRLFGVLRMLVNICSLLPVEATAEI